MDLQALLLTLRLSAITTLLLLGLAVPLAWWISLRPGVLRGAVQCAVALPLVLPPTVIGFYLLTATSPRVPVGRALAHLLGHPLPFSFAGLLLGSLVYSLPFAVQPLVAGFGSVDPARIEMARGLGLSPSRLFTAVILPEARGALVTAAVLTFTHTVGEFGVVLMLGGNIPGVTRTLSISIYDQVQEFDYSAANRTSLLLLLASSCALALIYLVPAIRRTDGKRLRERGLLAG